MPAGGKRPGAGRPKGSRALTLIAPTGERMAFYEAARHYDQEALRVIVSVFMDEKQPVPRDERAPVHSITHYSPRGDPHRSHSKSLFIRGEVQSLVIRSNHSTC